MVPDPYKALDLPHSATADQIKKSYRELARKYHPDRQRNDSDDKETSANQFAKLSSAYAILSDPQRKAHYDHIYKFGGFDDEDEGKNAKRVPLRAAAAFPYSSSSPSSSSPSATRGSNNNNSNNNNNQAKTTDTGVGYVCFDPLAFVWTCGQVRSTTTIAGLHIPSRICRMTGGGGAGGLRFALLKGQQQHVQANGTQEYVCQTTHFVAGGKSSTRTETTILHPNGRKEIVILDEENVERRYWQNNVSDMATQHPNHRRPLPWYMSAWHGLRDSLQMCHNPCAVAAQ